MKKLVTRGAAPETCFKIFRIPSAAVSLVYHHARGGPQVFHWDLIYKWRKAFEKFLTSNLFPNCCATQFRKKKVPIRFARVELLQLFTNFDESNIGNE